MTSLADQIRAELKTQRRRAIQTNKTQTIHKLIDLATCHTALLATLDEHQPCEPPRQLLCNSCRHLRPCPTEQAIGAALGIKGDGHG